MKRKDLLHHLERHGCESLRKEHDYAIHALLSQAPQPFYDPGDRLKIESPAWLTTLSLVIRVWAIAQTIASVNIEPLPPSSY